MQARSLVASFGFASPPAVKLPYRSAGDLSGMVALRERSCIELLADHRHRLKLPNKPEHKHYGVID